MLIIRSLQLINARYNSLFQHLNAAIYFFIWINVLLYGVTSVKGDGMPFPEFLISPCITLGVGLYLFSIFKQMSTVRSSWFACHTAGSKDLRLFVISKRFLASVRPLGIQIGIFGFVSKLAPLMFITTTVNYMITVILGME